MLTDRYPAFDCRSNGYPQRNIRPEGSLRSGYLSDQESRTKMLQQVSVESAQSQDSRLCYLTSSEVSSKKIKGSQGLNYDNAY